MITKRRNLEVQLQASLHGKEIRANTEFEADDVPLSTEQEQLMERQRQAALERIRSRRGG